MTPPRIEEMIEEFWSHTDNAEETEHWLRQALTQANQAWIDEAVEMIKDIGMCNHAIYDGIEVHGKKCNPYTEALDDTIKALQDNK